MSRKLLMQVGVPSSAEDPTQNHPTVSKPFRGSTGAKRQEFAELEENETSASVFLYGTAQNSRRYSWVWRTSTLRTV